MELSILMKDELMQNILTPNDTLVGAFDSRAKVKLISFATQFSFI